MNTIEIKHKKHGTFTCTYDCIFEDLIKSHTWNILKSSKYNRTLYVYTKIKGKCFYLHRLIMNAPKGKYVDHLDGNGLNNVVSNLRLCTNSENGSYSKKRTSNTSGYKGVYFSRNKNLWVAQIRINYKKKTSYHKTKEDAARAYDALAKVYFKEFAILNFPEDL